MKLTYTRPILLIFSIHLIIVSCGSSKQEQMDLLNHKIKRITELIHEQKDEKDKRVKMHITEQEFLDKEFKLRMERNLEKNIAERKDYYSGRKSIIEWFYNTKDSLNNVHMRDSLFYVQNQKIIDSLNIELSNYKSQLDKLIGIK